MMSISILGMFLNRVVEVFKTSNAGNESLIIYHIYMLPFLGMSLNKVVEVCQTNNAGNKLMINPLCTCCLSYPRNVPKQSCRSVQDQQCR